MYEIDDFHEKIKQELYFYSTASNKEVSDKIEKEWNSIPGQLPTFYPTRESKIENCIDHIDLIVLLKRQGTQLTLF